jgi:hypothetical protein
MSNPTKTQQEPSVTIKLTEAEHYSLCHLLYVHKARNDEAKKVFQDTMPHSHMMTIFKREDELMHAIIFDHSRTSYA